MMRAGSWIEVLSGRRHRCALNPDLTTYRPGFGQAYREALSPAISSPGAKWLLRLVTSATSAVALQMELAPSRPPRWGISLPLLRLALIR